MIKHIIASVICLNAFNSVAFAADEVDLPAPAGEPRIYSTPNDWHLEREARKNEIEKYLAEKSIAFDWFSKFPFSQTDGIPMLTLKLLPSVAPNIWGDEEDFGSGFGLFEDNSIVNWPLPVGIGLSSLDAKTGGPIDYTSFTCGACHIGRVKMDDGSFNKIIGGINSEFNIVKFFIDFKKTFDQISGGSSGDERKKIITARFVQAALDKHQSNPNYFYLDAQYDGIKFDSEYEAKQVQQYLSNADKLTNDLVEYMDGFVDAYSVYMDKTYDGIQDVMVAGLPGMADATGVSASHGYQSLHQSLLGKLFAKNILPDYPGITDFMAVWDQNSRTARWNEDGTVLIDGGGQYNGNIPIPIYRNLAASMTMGLENVDLRVAAFSEELLAELPPEPYPFDIDVSLARRGEALFKENCADCHQPNNGKVYRNLGTDVSRSLVINNMLVKVSHSQAFATCNPETKIILYDNQISPCAEFDGRQIVVDDTMRSLPEQHGGYNATRLAGVWATAPYLHNGSVPTVYHLLLPSERPKSFIKSSLNYDQKFLGFAWDNSAEDGYMFDTSKFGAFNNKGHDKNIEMDGKTYRLDWSSNPEEAQAIIEYLKTL